MNDLQSVLAEIEKNAAEKFPGTPAEIIAYLERNRATTKKLVKALKLAVEQRRMMGRPNFQKARDRELAAILTGEGA